MSTRFYVQQQGHSEVRLHRCGEWVEAEWDGRSFHFRLRPCRIAGRERLLLRFRDRSACQQVLLRVEDDKLLFKSAYTVAAQRFEPRRTAIEPLGVREGDLLIGSDVWSVDLLLADRFARPLSVLLRVGPGGLAAVPCRDASLAVLADGEESAAAVSGPLRLASAEALRSREPLAASFLADDVLYELSNVSLGDERAQLCVAAVGYLLPPGLSRITLGAAEECVVPLYAGARRRAAEEAVWNLWFEALRCRAEPGTVVSAVGLEPGSAPGAVALAALLDSYSRISPADPSSAASAAPRPAADPSDAPPALVDKGFVLNKCEQVLALVGEREELGPDVRRLRTLLAQGDYHQASLLAEDLRRRHQEGARTTQALDHGLRLRVAGVELWFADRRRLPRQETPELRELPGLLVLVEPEEVCKVGPAPDGAGLSVAPPGGQPLACTELRFGRLDPGDPEAVPGRAAALLATVGPNGEARVGLASGNLSASSQAARLVAEGQALCIGPWRRNAFEGDAVVKNFQLALDDPQDRSPLEPGDFVSLGNLLFDFVEADRGLVCRLRGALLDCGSEPFRIGADPADLPIPGASGAEAARIRFHPGARLVEGDFGEEQGAARVGPLRLECRRGEKGVTIGLATAAGPWLRLGRAEDGALRYSQRKRVTRVRHAPLYPVAPELFVGMAWQAEREGAGVELGLDGARPCWFRIAVRRGLDGTGEVFCQASAERLGGATEADCLARHLRAGNASPDDRLLPGDELVCPPAVFRAAAAPEGEGLELELELVRLELGDAPGGWLAGLDALVPDGEPNVLRLPPPFPRTARVRWTGGGHYQVEGDAERVERELISLPVPPERQFQLYQAAALERSRLRLGGPGSPAEIVHAALEPGRLVATLEPGESGCVLRPLGPEARLWVQDAAGRVEAVPPDGVVLEPGASFGVGQAELRYEMCSA
jgi:hypothetical protein